MNEYPATKYQSALDKFNLSYSQPITKKLKYPLPFYIRKVLGLLPWDELSNKGYYSPGYTTKMLVEAVYFSQNRKVYIAGYNYKYTIDLVNQAKRMCVQLDIPHTNILPLPLNLRGIKFESSHVYFDHYDAEYTHNKSMQLNYLFKYSKPANW